MTQRFCFLLCESFQFHDCAICTLRQSRSRNKLDFHQLGLNSHILWIKQLNVQEHSFSFRKDIANINESLSFNIKVRIISGCIHTQLFLTYMKFSHGKVFRGDVWAFTNSRKLSLIFKIIPNSLGARS